MRGNPQRTQGKWLRWRSIPAGAGEPQPHFPTTGLHRVYPRGCGGTRCLGGLNYPPQGLSPRMRGNHAQLFQRGLRLGSIPAGAGEPCQQSPSRPGVRVYPRGCGGTSAKASSMVPVMGLSPRVRGNQTRFGGDQCLEGSIPAGAGEPPVLRMDAKGGTVYPRGCGGTLGWKTTGRTGTGLSPRVRGNLYNLIPYSTDYGSIPAGAGEPGQQHPNQQYQAVYPRGCGGTFQSRSPLASQTGLSPRVRGNPTSRGTP